MFPAILACAGFVLGANDAPASIEATLRARAGRVECVDGAGRVHVLAPDVQRTLEGRAHVEIGAAGAAELAWPGVGSAQVHGPCVV